MIGTIIAMSSVTGAAAMTVGAVLVSAVAVAFARR